MPPVTREDALRLAEAWVGAWNAHDLDAILRHYADDVEFVSPFVERLLGDASGAVRGKAQLRAYFVKGLAAFPDLRFELLEILVGVGSVTVYYRGVRGLLAAEVMCLADDGRIVRVLAHYSG